MESIKGIIRGICISEQRGTAKYPVEAAFLKLGWGVDKDAHGGNWHRQVSLLGLEKIEEFRARGAEVDFGAFGENIIVEGFDLRNIPVGTQFQIGEAVIEMTQIGKDCHTHCEIHKRVGDCIMPREGVFAKVISSGAIKVGDSVKIISSASDRPLSAAIITLSDKASKGEREDLSGPAIAEELNKRGYEIIETILLPDEQKAIEKELRRLSDQRQVNLILTTGGTGFAERDVTPEATMAVATKNAPGIAEAIRAESMKITNRAMLSRAVSVIRNKTLIINLPGSPKAVKEGMDIIMDSVEHGLEIMLSRTGECGRK